MSEALLDLLADLAHGVQGRLRDPERIFPLGLAPFQARTLSYFARFPGRSPLAFANAIGRDKAQVTRVLQELEERGLIIRRPNPADRRSMRIELTQQGEKCYAGLRAHRAAVAEALFCNISVEEQAALSNVLTKMRAALES